MFKNIIGAKTFQAFCLNLVFLILYLIFSSCSFAALDDFFMAAVLEGAYDSQMDTHLYFTNSIYGYVLKPLYVLVPSICWYYIIEVAEVFVSFTALTYVLLKKFGCQVGIVVSLILLCCVSPDFYFQLSFTQNAALLTSTGLVVLFINLDERKKTLFICGAILFAFGYVMRKEAFLLGMPYVAFFCFLVIVSKKNVKHMLIVTVVCAITVIGLHFFEKSQYVDAEYKYYAAYQGPRSVFMDGGFFDENAFYDELVESGYEKTNAQALRTWLFYDTDVFQLDSLNPLLKVVDNTRYELNWRRSLVRVIEEIAGGFKNTTVWCWAAMCLLVLYNSRKRFVYYPWVSISFIALEIFYLCMVNRMVYRVESGVWLYAVVCGIPFLRKDSFTLFCKQGQKITAVIVACIFVVGFAIMEQPESLRSEFIGGNHPEKDDWRSLYDYTKYNQDKAFCLNFRLYKALGEFLKLPSYKPIGPGGLCNLFTFGYWNAYLPGMMRQHRAYGLENPLRDFVKEGVYVVEHESDMFLSQETFYEVNYKHKLNSEIVKRFGEIKVVKYSISEDQP